jgi:hypothetical protein
MEIESQYRSVLDLTHQMAGATEKQEWDALAKLERQRTAVIATIPPLSPISMSLNPALASRIANLITDIERENSEIVEHVQVWQKHVKILLQLDKPVTS